MDAEIASALGLEEPRAQGRCLLVPARGRALELVDLARDVSARHVYLVGVARRGRPPGLYARRVAPRPPDSADLIVRTLWPNLTGSTSFEDYVEAFALLHGAPFTVVECEPGGGGCGSLIASWLREVC